MASSLGTVLIQRIDAALGNAASSQTSIARGATDAVRQPAQTDRGQNTTNQVQRDQRENVDRVTQQARSDKGKGVDRTSAQTLARGTLPGNLTNTSVNTTLGSAARIILQLFANHNFGSTPIQGRQPLINQSPNNPANTNNPTTNQSGQSAGNLGNQNLTSAQVARAQSLINTITNNSNNLSGSRLTQAINAAYRSEGTPNNQLSAQIARALAQNITQSGLFYESHIKAYNQGQFKLADIRQEPQAQARSNANPANTTNTGTTANTSPQSTTSNTNLAGTNPNTATNTANINAANQAQNANTTTGNQNIGTQSGANPANTAPTPGVDPNTHNIVRQQLEVLADQSIQWRGEAWPGAEMQWRVQRNEQDPNQERPVDSEQAQWQTNLKLKLPTLGDINANIGISGNKIFLNIQAQSEHIENLKNNSDQLAQQLFDRQLQLIQLNLDAFATENTDLETASLDSKDLEE